MREWTWLVVVVVVTAQAKLQKFNIEDASSEVTVAERDRVKISCKGLWHRNHKLLLQDDRIKIRKKMLTIQNVNKSDSGEYNCLRGDGRGWRNLTLVVVDEKPSDVTKQNKKPTIKKVEKLNALILRPAGNSVQLKCPAEGYPLPNITWYKDGSELSRKNGEVNQKGWTIIMQDLLPQQDSGQYTCVLTNQFGSVNFTYILEVKERYPHRPIMTKSLSNQTVFIGSQAEFNCSFLSNLLPEVSWFKSNKSFFDSTAVGLDSTLDDHMSLEYHSKHEETDYSTLVLSNVTLNDSGWYHCHVGNSLGDSVASAYLNVVEVDDDVGGCAERKLYKEAITNYRVLDDSVADDNEIISYVSLDEFLQLEHAMKKRSSAHQHLVLLIQQYQTKLKLLKKKLQLSERRYNVLKKRNTLCNMKLRESQNQ